MPKQVKGIATTRQFRPARFAHSEQAGNPLFVYHYGDMPYLKIIKFGESLARHILKEYKSKIAICKNFILLIIICRILNCFT